MEGTKPRQVEHYTIPTVADGTKWRQRGIIYLIHYSGRFQAKMKWNNLLYSLSWVVIKIHKQKMWDYHSGERECEELWRFSLLYTMLHWMTVDGSKPDSDPSFSLSTCLHVDRSKTVLTTWILEKIPAFSVIPFCTFQLWSVFLTCRNLMSDWLGSELRFVFFRRLSQVGVFQEHLSVSQLYGASNGGWVCLGAFEAEGILGKGEVIDSYR